MSCCSKSPKHSLCYFNLDDYKLPSLRSKISKEENRLRHWIMEDIFDGESVPETEQIRDLASRNILTIEDGKVASIYPVSVKESDKCVVFSTDKKNQLHFAMCAIDAIGFAFTFHRDVHIETVLHDTQEPLELFVPADGHAPIEATLSSCPEYKIRVLYPDLRKCDSWSDHCCSHMHFFSSDEAVKAYIKAENLEDADIISLNLEQALTVAEWIFEE